MSSKLSNKKSVGSSTKAAAPHNRKQSDGPDAIGTVFGGQVINPSEGETSEITNEKSNDTKKDIIFEQIYINEIIPRSINNYKQGQIEKLANSIRATNNRLINPITIAKIEDFPIDGDVMQKYREMGTDLTKYKYVIVSGERRFRAWQYLREQAIDGTGVDVTIFDKITANILTPTEMKKEKSYYNDSNLQARHISPLEILYNNKSVLEKIKTDEDKRNALIEMNGGSEAGIDEDVKKAAKKFVRAKYVKYYLESNYGIVDWSDSTIKTNLWVIDNLAPEVIQAILEDKYNTKQAKLIAKADYETQKEILNYWLSGNDVEYKNAIVELSKDELEQASKNKVFGKTKKDITNELKSAKRSADKERKKFEEMLQSVSPQNAKAIRDALKSFDKLIGDINIILDGMR